MNLDPYKIFKKLKEKYPTAVVRVPMDNMYWENLKYWKNGGHRQMVKDMFKKEHGLEITRYQHDYDSLTTEHPKLGLVHLKADTDIVEIIEVWALVGHNCTHSMEVSDATQEGLVEQNNFGQHSNDDARGETTSEANRGDSNVGSAPKENEEKENSVDGEVDGVSKT
jgi:hypothetical protein